MLGAIALCEETRGGGCGIPAGILDAAGPRLVHKRRVAFQEALSLVAIKVQRSEYSPRNLQGELTPVGKKAASRRKRITKQYSRHTAVVCEPRFLGMRCDESGIWVYPANHGQGVIHV